MRGIIALVVALAIVVPCAAALGEAVELTAKAVADPKGDGPDGKGNTKDDTWGFWFQLIHAPEYRRLDIGTAAMSPQQRKRGIPRKVSGPIGAYMPNKNQTEGWIYHSDWDGRYEGVWGDKKANQVLAHPYNEKTSGGAVAVTYTVPADGFYKISGSVADVNVAKGHKMLTGIKYSVDVVKLVGNGGATKAPQKVLKAPTLVGDDKGPASDTFSIDEASLKRGQLVRLVIDPNRWWGGDMTRIAFKIEKVK